MQALRATSTTYLEERLLRRGLLSLLPLPINRPLRGLLFVSRSSLFYCYGLKSPVLDVTLSLKCGGKLRRLWGRVAFTVGGSCVDCGEELRSLWGEVASTVGRNCARKCEATHPKVGKCCARVWGGGI